MELILDIRRNGLIMLVRAVIVALFGIALYTFATFTQSTAGAVDRSLSDRADVDLYALIDDFGSDPDAFERFRASTAALQQLDAFVDALAEEHRFRFLTAFDQPVTVVDARGSDSFDAGHGSELGVRGMYTDDAGRHVRDVRSMQMNEAAYDFAGLRVDTGTTPDWSSVDYASGSVPVVLGADYRGHHQVGDVLHATFYFKDIDLVVAGFLADGATMYHQGDINHALDDAVVLPYPPHLDDLLQDDPEFTGIVAFAMVNGNLAVDWSTAFDTVVGTLDAIADRTGFHDYSLTGVPTYLVQLSLVRAIVHENVVLLTAILGLLAVATVLSTWLMGVALLRRRAARSATLWRIGWNERRITALSARSSVAEHTVVLAVFVATCAVMPNQHAFPFLGVGALLLLWCTADGLLQATHVRHVQLPRRAQEAP